MTGSTFTPDFLSSRFTCTVGDFSMSISADDRFAFEVQGYLHLRHALDSAELARYTEWLTAVEGTDVHALNRDTPDWMRFHLNRPVSRVLDADHRFARFLDHPVVESYLIEFLGEDYRHIDNDLLYTYPGYAGGEWHRGVKPHLTGHVVNGAFICPMVKVFYCMTDVGPDQGAFEVIPGSHRAQFVLDTANRIDLPAQHIFDDVHAGDIIIFNEALIHNGRPNPSQRTRKTMIVNFGRRDAGVWAGYAPFDATLDAVTPRQREILDNRDQAWEEPNLAK